MTYLLQRLGEPSTWAGIAGLLAYGAQAIATRDPAGAVSMAASLAPRTARGRECLT